MAGTQARVSSFARTEAGAAARCTRLRQIESPAGRVELGNVGLQLVSCRGTRAPSRHNSSPASPGDIVVIHDGIRSIRVADRRTAVEATRLLIPTLEGRGTIRPAL